MNVLVTSISRKVPMIEQVKKAASRLHPDNLVYAGDINSKSIGRYFSDAFWKMDVLKNMSLRDFISFCHQNDIKAIIPSRDGELSFYSSNLETFKENGIHVMVSKIAGLEKTQDKQVFAGCLRNHGFPAIKTSNELDGIYASSIVVKERFSGGSKQIYVNVTRHTAEEVSSQLIQPLFQPYITGTEYSIDLYVDLNGRSKGAVVRERVLVVNGESQITKTVRYPELEKMAMDMAEDLKLYGHVMFQVIVDLEGNPHVVECNPRFGGASTLSIAAGLDSFYWFLLEAQGKSLDTIPFIRSDQVLTQVRYAKDLII